MNPRKLRKLAVLAATTVLAVRGAPAAEHKPDNDEEQRLKDIPRISGLSSYPEDHQLLRILIRAAGLKRGIEVGTANGYGACHMGMAFEKNGGKLITIEIDPAMAAQARENIARAKLENTVTLIEDDALKVLPRLEGEYDFVFIDALKNDYLKYFNAIKNKLAPGAIVAAHNVILYAASMRDFLQAMESDPEYLSVIVRPGTEERDGIGIYYKKR